MTFPEHPPMLPFLEKLETRATFSNEERDAILSLPFTPRHVDANRDLVGLGQRVDHCCFVHEGVIGAFDQDKDGNRQIVSVFINGDMADLPTVVLPQSLLALQALRPTTVLRVPHSALLKVCRAHPRLAEAFWRESAVDAGILAEWVVNVGRRNARTRMAHFFCEMACRWERAEPGNGTLLPHALTQQQLSEILSLTPVHVNRTLQQLRHERLVDTIERSILRILNWAKLSAVGQFDPAYLRMTHGKCAPGDQVNFAA